MEDRSGRIGSQAEHLRGVELGILDRSESATAQLTYPIFLLRRIVEVATQCSKVPALGHESDLFRPQLVLYHSELYVWQEAKQALSKTTLLDASYQVSYQS